MKLFGWAADHAGCGYYRLGLPLAALRVLGHETLVSTVLPGDWRDADVIIGQRICMPGPSRTWQRLAAEGRRLVYEIDDDLFRVHPTNPGARVFADLDVQARIRANAGVAAAVTVTTRALAEVMGEYNPDVVVLPNAVPAWLLAHERPRRRQVTLGWAGSATHEMDLAEVAGPLRQFLQRNPSIAFHAMGTDYAPVMRLPAAQCRHTPWAAAIEDYLRAVDFDIGLAPLRPDPFNRSKSSLRPLELAALGIPVVASDYGPYAEFVRDGETGFLVRRDHEWGLRLRELAADANLRHDLGTKARALAAQHTIEATAPAWEAVYRDVAEP